MSTFSLVVTFDGDECSSCEQELRDSVSSASLMDSLDKLLLVDADSVALYLSRERTMSVSPTTVAVFVPPAVSEIWFEQREAEPGGGSCTLIRRLTESGIQTRVLAQIHKVLAKEQCRIRGMIRSTGTTRPRDSDILLLDISHCYGGWLDEMRRTICGEPMEAQEAAVIELFAITSVSTVDPQHQASLLGPQYEIPTCAVCLHRVYPPRLSLPKPRNDQLCSEYCIEGDCRNEAFLKPWPLPSECKACNMIQHHWMNTSAAHNDGLHEHDVFCNCCALQETLWICLTCGFIGCGRYSQGHAANHFTESQHAFSLEMATLRIWDYPSGEFAHRGDLLECPSVLRRRHPQWAVWEEDGKKANKQGDTKKATMIGEEYEALLQSALEDQAQHYEGEISRLHAALTAEQMDENCMTQQEATEISRLQADISNLRQELEVVGRSLLDVQAQEAGHRAASQRLLREQAVAKDLLTKIREEAAKEHHEGKMNVDELEQQVADLTANLRMRHQISQDEELSQAHIYGTVSTNSSSTKKRGGKKSRRGNRK